MILSKFDRFPFGKNPDLTPERIMKHRPLSFLWSKMSIQAFIKIGLAVLIPAALGLSCNKDDREVLFELNFPPPPITFNILPGLGTFDTHVYTQSPIPTKFASKLANSGHSIEDVGIIQAKEAELSSIFGDVNLDFIHRVSVFVFDPFNPADKVEFFYLDPVPFRDQTTIRLFPGITDVKEWMQEEFVGIEVRLDFREISPSFVEMELEMDLRVLGK